MPSASEIRHQFEQSGKNIRCTALRAKFGGTSPCGHLIVEDGKVCCRCGTEHSLVELLVATTEGNAYRLRDLQLELQRQFWQLRVEDIASKYYQHKVLPMGFTPQLPRWILDRIYLIEKFGFRPVYVPGELGGDWVLFEYDIAKDTKTWNVPEDLWGSRTDSSHYQRVVDRGMVFNLIHVLASQFAVPKSWVSPPENRATWRSISEWRYLWTMNDTGHVDSDWDEYVHWIWGHDTRKVATWSDYTSMNLTIERRARVEFTICERLR